jgi:hypothetical protein
VKERDTRFECDCCWQKEEKKFISPPPFSGVLTIDQTLKCRNSFFTNYLAGRCYIFYDLHFL